MMTTAKRFKLLLIAFVLEVAVTALVVSFPDVDRGWYIPLVPFFAPGWVLMFLVGGGNSLMDGIVPVGRENLALALGFLLNTAIMYGFCYLVTRVHSEVRPVFRWKDLK
ncbi:hypothetical protein [Terriglobus sp. TAA 43]|uniref:hypothetical protein n=1 Tax=Terriglobus sp. TAA 43 TaxID=278961 RepID=UPI0006492577|nr:hypothetical protein [Terriglobus sp. TAA 43]